MKKYYTIGETAKLLGVTTQTLRHYEKIGILEPSYICDENGYRYYEFNQFHIIDRIKYLQYLGLSLVEIGSIIKKGTVEGLLPALEQQWQTANQELETIRARIKDIEWYIDYFTYLSKMDVSKVLYRMHMETRHLIYVPCYDYDELADMEIRIAKVRSRPELHQLSYRRQYGYELTTSGLFQSKFEPKTYFIYIKDRPKFFTPFYKELPAGEYLCFRTKLLHEKWDTTILKKYFNSIPKPSTIVALEFEDNLVEYMNTDYEVQILIE
ncbi:MerR family transcriptional regulator [Clostridium scatologenes]|uniref:Transcriptional regulator, MerR family n=1 Tax=Clostridium scatologenes TaxID=1548 RepID=A0A0E3JR73_CLOSL|nr:MerR family transcriptional regulator [Clostridium scatologenes]AKA71498.1 transcriptional regulator, MerR family [Clostridium scatologenes]